MQHRRGAHLGELVGVPKNGRFQRLDGIRADEPDVLGDGVSHRLDLGGRKVGPGQGFPRSERAILTVVVVAPLFADIVQPGGRLDNLWVGAGQLGQAQRQPHHRANVLPAIVEIRVLDSPTSAGFVERGLKSGLPDNRAPGRRIDR